ncbi:MAG: hypothetical protein QW364_06100 [Thermoplasmatales archaeon]
MRFRLIITGIAELILTGVLSAFRGFHPAYYILLLVGIVLILMGIIWK